MLRLENKVVIVTGASQGIGKCIEETYLQLVLEKILVQQEKHA